MKYLFLITCIILSCFSTLKCQVIVRSTLSSLGSSYNEQGILIRQTIGQSSGTKVFSNNGLVVRQGFQQPLVLRNYPVINPAIDFTLSPNPADEEVVMEIKGEVTSYNLRITNMNGQVVFSLNDQVLQSTILNLSNLFPGPYIVTITGENRGGSKKLIIND